MDNCIHPSAYLISKPTERGAKSNWKYFITLYFTKNLLIVKNMNCTEFITDYDLELSCVIP